VSGIPLVMTAKEQVRKLLKHAGVVIDGRNPWDIKVHDERLYAKVLGHGALGLGESYMDGWWDCEKLDELFDRVLAAQLDRRVTAGLALHGLKHRVFNLQRYRPFHIGEAHYDLDNDLYQAMLGRRMVYTCGYWKNASNLDAAQESKLELVCRKIGLKRGDRVLDIGGGWGSFAKYASQKYGASVVAITVSKNQVALGRELCKGLKGVEIRYQDYHDVNEKFDHIVSLGMFEHVGPKNYAAYFDVVRRCLKDDGLFLLHTIGSNRSVTSTDEWTNRYIFPDGVLPSIAQIGKAIEGRFVMEDWHNFGAEYEKTLLAWHSNFKRAWPSLERKDPAKYNDRFCRMWTYYLLSCAGSFRARKNQLWQVVLSKDGVPGGYQPVR